MLLTVHNLSKQLHIKPSTLYAWAAQGKIPCLKIHGLVRFDPNEIDRWLTSFTTPPYARPKAKTPKTDHADLDRLIASATHQVYTARNGETFTPSPNGKEHEDGTR